MASDICCVYMPAQWMTARPQWAAGETMCHLPLQAAQARAARAAARAQGEQEELEAAQQEARPRVVLEVAPRRARVVVAWRPLCHAWRPSALTSNTQIRNADARGHWICTAHGARCTRLNVKASSGPRARIRMRLIVAFRMRVGRFYNGQRADSQTKSPPRWVSSRDCGCLKVRGIGRLV